MRLLLLFVVAISVTAWPRPGIRLRSQHAAVIQEVIQEHSNAGEKADMERYKDMVAFLNKYRHHMVTSLKLFWTKARAIAEIPFTEKQIAKANPHNAGQLGLENTIYHAFLVLELTRNGRTQFIVMERLSSLNWKKVNRQWKPKPGSKSMLVVNHIPEPITIKKMFDKLESYVLSSTALRSGSIIDRLKQYADEYNPETMNCQHFTWDVLRALFRDKNGDGSVVAIPVGKGYWKNFRSPDLSQNTEVLFSTFASNLAHVARVPNIVPHLEKAAEDLANDVWNSIW